MRLILHQTGAVPQQFQEAAPRSLELQPLTKKGAAEQVKKNPFDLQVGGVGEGNPNKSHNRAPLCYSSASLGPAAKGKNIFSSNEKVQENKRGKYLEERFSREERPQV